MHTLPLQYRQRLLGASPHLELLRGPAPDLKMGVKRGSERTRERWSRFLSSRRRRNRLTPQFLRFQRQQQPIAGGGNLPNQWLVTSLPALLPSTQLELSTLVKFLVQGALYPSEAKVPHLAIGVLSPTEAVLAPLDR